MCPILYISYDHENKRLNETLFHCEISEEEVITNVLVTIEHCTYKCNWRSFLPFLYEQNEGELDKVNC